MEVCSEYQVGNEWMFLIGNEYISGTFISANEVCCCQIYKYLFPVDIWVDVQRKYFIRLKLLWEFNELNYELIDLIMWHVIFKLT